ncbi:hypothetical protein [Xanthomonas arboricola]|uniref:hypothetical protein n=1 Tax=Xanthomonas arboricola TaxID=56448 RepID=UPI000A6BAB83|nr:hypothetical protein [Xanthomonas arboricola]
MSSFPARAVEIWRSSQAEVIAPIHGVFSFEVFKTLMVPQTLQFLAECANRPLSGVSEISSAFLQGMRHFDQGRPALLFWKQFRHHEELFSFDPEVLSEAIRQLEVHTDINLTFGQVTYLADIGRGPELPLWILSRLPFTRGVAFEIDERGATEASLGGGDFEMSDKARVAQQHYSTGMSLLAGEDSISGLVDAAFMQFYLATEAILERHEKDKALEAGAQIFGAEFDANLQLIVSHVYLARHRFFGHAHPKYLKGLLDTDTAFDIAKQTLVARWCARRLMELELKRSLVKREMRLYAGPQQSVAFYGDASYLKSDFTLP